MVEFSSDSSRERFECCFFSCCKSLMFRIFSTLESAVALASITPSRPGHTNFRAVWSWTTLACLRSFMPNVVSSSRRIIRLPAAPELVPIADERSKPWDFFLAKRSSL
uniref:(northern house mosquito) hypothetical protein n=1 Tax=Culex pipiens TaxID=7175 RepID=A0A8D8DU40_CULPI